MKIAMVALALLVSGTACINNKQDVAPCIDASSRNPDLVCNLQYDPVCGCDGKTYGNACEAERAGVKTYNPGACSSKK